MSLRTETFLRATPVIPQFPRFPGFQREAVRATLEKLQSSGVLQRFNHKHFLLTLSLPYGKPSSSGDSGKKKEKQRKEEKNDKRDGMKKK